LARTNDLFGLLDIRILFYAYVPSRRVLLEGGYEGNQKMTRAQALKSYTLDGAFAEFEEKFKGSIEVGKAADFTVYDKNIMEIPEDEILQAKVQIDCGRRKSGV